MFGEARLAICWFYVSNGDIIVVENEKSPELATTVARVLVAVVFYCYFYYSKLKPFDLWEPTAVWLA